MKLRLLSAYPGTSRCENDVDACEFDLYVMLPIFLLYGGRLCNGFPLVIYLPENLPGKGKFRKFG